MVKEITISKNYIALIDDEDYDLVSQHNWYISSYTLKSGNIKSCAVTFRSKIENYKTVYMHRLILQTPFGLYTDHINGNGLDNRKQNLRIATPLQNTLNSRKIIYRNNKKVSSLFKGVTWCTRDKKWRAQIGYHGRKMSLGYYNREIEASDAYNKVAEKLFGEFVNLGKDRVAVAP